MSQPSPNSSAITPPLVPMAPVNELLRKMNNMIPISRSKAFDALDLMSKLKPGDDMKTIYDYIDEGPMHVLNEAYEFLELLVPRLKKMMEENDHVEYSDTYSTAFDAHDLIGCIMSDVAFGQSFYMYPREELPNV